MLKETWADNVPPKSYRAMKPLVPDMRNLSKS